CHRYRPGVCDRVDPEVDGQRLSPLAASDGNQERVEPRPRSAVFRGTLPELCGTYRNVWRVRRSVASSCRRCRRRLMGPSMMKQWRFRVSALVLLLAITGAFAQGPVRAGGADVQVLTDAGAREVAALIA